jgi:PAS domain-containing protein
MNNEDRKTEFLPAERASEKDVDRAFEKILKIPMLNQILNLLPDSVLILNAQRQVVYGNDAALRRLSVVSPDKVLGMRIGEALNCTRIDEAPGGCGTDSVCRQCGFPKAHLKAPLRSRRPEKCHVVTKGGDSVEMRVRTSDFEFDGDRFTAFVISDIW